jgi:Condensation domain/TubC N-terminal docking domain
VTFDELLRYVAAHDVRLSAAAGSLSYDAPARAATTELLDALRAHKAQLVDRLAVRDAGRPVTRGPLSHQQERMMSSVRRSARPAVWNVALRISLCGDVDVPALCAALDGLVDRHYALRTRFVEEDGGWVQEIAGARRLEVPLTDLTAVPEADRADLAERICHETAHQPFDLAREDPVRAHLIRVTPHDVQLILVVHHIACDGWAVGVLLRDLAAGYTTLVSRDAGPLDPPVMQCTDYARWQRSHLDEATTARNLAYWMAELGDAPLILDLPYDRPRPAVPTGDGRLHSFTVPSAVVADVDVFAHRRGITRFAVVAAAMGLLLGRLTGQRDLVLSVPYANRDATAHEHVVTVMANAFPLRLRLDAVDSFTGLVDQAAISVFAGVDHLLPTAWIYDGLRARRGPDTPTRLPVTLSYQSSLDLRLEMPGVMAAVQEVPIHAARSDLVFGLVPDPGELGGYVEYALDVLDTATVEAWVDAYVDLLAQACRQPDRPLGEWLAEPARG